MSCNSKLPALGISVSTTNAHAGQQQKRVTMGFALLSHPLVPPSGIADVALDTCDFPHLAAVQVSEGINFADAYARAVVLLGIPYPAFKDARVVEKKRFNSHPQNRMRGLISGEQWYSLQAFRAMNQVL